MKVFLIIIYTFNIILLLFLLYIKYKNKMVKIDKELKENEKKDTDINNNN